MRLAFMSGLAVAVLLAVVTANPGAAEEPAGDDEVPGLSELPAVVAEVDGFAITRRELIRELLGSEGSMALDRIIRRILVEQAAEKIGIAATDQELNDQLMLDYRGLQNEVQYAPWDAGEKTFAALVKARYQMSIEEYKQQVVRQKLLAKKMIGRQTAPTDADLQRFYADNEGLFQPPDRFRAAHVLVTPLTRQDLLAGNGEVGFRERIAADRKRREKWRRDHGVDMQDAPQVDAGPEWQHSKERAQKVIDELRAGTLTWTQAVERYTQDPLDQKGPGGLTVRQERAAKRQDQGLAPMPAEPGEVGWFTSQGPLVEEFYDGVRNMKPGEVSEPIRTRYGYHVVKMLEVQRAQRKDFAALRAEVEKVYVDWIIQAKAERWVDQLVREAQLENTRSILWPPEPGKGPEADRDPVIGKVNGKDVRRSEVWKELLRSDGPEALSRLINREMALGPLKTMGPMRMEWLGTPAFRREGTSQIPLRSPEPPPAQPITVNKEETEMEMNDDRLSLDALNEARAKRKPPQTPLTLEEYVYNRYGQAIAQYHRCLEASLVLAKAIKQSIKLDEPTLQMEYALSKERYREPLKFDVQHLLIALPENADTEQRVAGLEMAKELRKQAGEDEKSWSVLAASEKFGHPENLDELGHLGVLSPEDEDWRGALYTALAKANFERGQLSDPIPTRLGYHLIRIRNRLPERIPEFFEVHRRVERDYLQARAAMCMNVWVRAMEKQSRIKRFLYSKEDLKLMDNFEVPKPK